MMIVVMGVSGSGKSSVGRSLAARCGLPFLEGDDLHPPANVAKMASGLPLDELNPILEVDGEPLVTVTQFATAVRTPELRSRITSLDRDHPRIVGAIDVLTGSA